MARGGSSRVRMHDRGCGKIIGRAITMRVLDTPVCCEDCQELHSVSTSGAGRGYVTSMSIPFELHHLVKRGEHQRVRELLRAGEPGGETSINAYDNRGYTPLMHAVESPNASVELVCLLLEQGASIHQECSELGTQHPIVALCLGGGDPRK